MHPEYEDWAKNATSYFKETFGLASSFARQAARLYIALWSANLSPGISSGYRDATRQIALQKQWDAGNRSGLVRRPATSSKHSATTWLGYPAAEAIDMPTSNNILAAQIAKQLGIGAGIDFKDSDPGHYYLLA